MGRPTSLNNLALLYTSLGDYALAKPLYLRALAIKEKVYGPEHAEVAINLINLAGLYESLGDYAQAKPLYLRALAIHEKGYGPEHTNVATSLLSLAGLYTRLGDYALAKPLLLRALAINEKVYGAEHAKVAASLNNLAFLYTSLGNYTLAKPLYLRALAIHEKVYGPEHASVATSLNNLAVLYESLGDYALAKPLLLRALAIREKVYGPEHADVAMSLNNLAELYKSLGDYALAKPLFLRAYRIIISSRRPKLIWTVQNNLRELYSSLKVPNTGIFYGKQAVNTIQALRSKNVKLDNNLQKVFLKDKEYVYRNLANLLIDQDRLAEAEQVLIMLKEEEQFDFLDRDPSHNDFHTTAPYTMGENQLNMQFNTFDQEFFDLNKALETLQQKKKLGLNSAETIQMEQLQAQLKQKSKALKGFIANVESKTENFSTQAFTFQQQETNQLSRPKKMLGKLGKKTVLIRYLITNDKLRIIVTTANRRFYRDSGINLESLNTLIRDYRKILQNPTSQPLPLAQQLYGILIEPLTKELEKDQIETLMVSLDASLRYLPLSALFDGKKYLVERYNLSVYTAAAKTSLTTLPVPNWQVAGFGVSEQSEDFVALPAVIGELNGIVKESDKLDHTGVLPGIVRLNDDFTAGSFEKSVKRGFPVIHIASHFSFQPGNQFNSFLLLGGGKKLSLADLKNENYFFTDVDLFTLSACNTAVTGKNANGREIESIGTLIQNKGAKSVLATLWPIADKSTGIFMQNFYQIKDKNKQLSKAKALRFSQLDFISGKTTSMSGLTNRGGIDPDEPQVSKIANDSMAQYSHPYYWAPFILMGNWL